MKSKICPLCGNQIGNEIDESVIASCHAESNNIRINLHELEELRLEIDNERRKLEEKLKLPLKVYLKKRNPLQIIIIKLNL